MIHVAHQRVLPVPASDVPNKFQISNRANVHVDCAEGAFHNQSQRSSFEGVKLNVSHQKNMRQLSENCAPAKLIC